MINQVPQNSDIKLTFNDISYNVSSQEIDLTSVEDIILSVAKTTPSSTPILIIKYSIDPGRFNIDNSNKKISIDVLSSELTENPGKYFINLWVLDGDTYVTHLQKSLEVQAVPKYSL
jgi:hypothetical protein